MIEYISEAIVLNKEPNGEFDAWVSLYTRKFGKLIAKVKSARKPTSKLSPHLEICNVGEVRIVQKNGNQLVDVLKKHRLSIPPYKLAVLNGLLAEAVPEPLLWEELLADRFSWRRILRILGWDPKEASCVSCGREAPEFFDAETQEFFCSRCLYSHGAQDKIQYIRLDEKQND